MDDPLPAISGLRITGEAFPGRELEASGYPINGTTSCYFEVRSIAFAIHFLNVLNSSVFIISCVCVCVFFFCKFVMRSQWVRHLDDGSVNFIEGISS
jgi:hypothetical protein